MQTFLPYPSFAESAAALASPRLGKQRVETLQIARALLVPTYGWQRHPAVGMWRGHLPALAAYGLAMTDAWTERGFADTVRPQLLEFAPEVDGRTQEELGADGLLPAWIGDEAVHRSHRSKLLAKDPAFYAERFPDTPDDLEYHWPHPVEEAPADSGEPLWVVRVDDLDRWREAGLVGMPLTTPNGRVTPALKAQLAHVEQDLRAGRTIGVLGPDPLLLHLAAVEGPPATVTIDEVDYLARAVRFEGNLARGDLPVPAQLQNPRRVFPVRVAAPAVPAAAGATSLAP